MRLVDQRKSLKSYIADERKARKEDWQMGPRIAPRRDAGKAERYGTIAQALMSPVEQQQSRRKKAWLAAGDRVAVLEGRDKGKIGYVSVVSPESMTVKVDGLNTVRG